MELSTEAKVVYGAQFSFGLTELSFNRPHIIHPRMRRGLDDLVAAGLLTMEKFNEHSAKLLWKPTEKLKANRPTVSMKFIKANSFPITTE